MNALYQAFAWLDLSFAQGWYWAVVVVGFFVHMRIVHLINGSESFFRGSLADFREDVLWAIPGSRRRRGEFIKERIEQWGSPGTPMGGGSMGGHSYEDIRTQNLYEEVGATMLPGPLHFWGSVIGWICWPVSGTLLFVVLLLSWVLHGALVLFLGKAGADQFYDKVFDFFDGVPSKSKAQ